MKSSHARRWVWAMPALVVTLHAGSIHAQTLGRLFSTPDVRATLDRLRQDRDYGAVPSPEESRAGQALPAPDVRVDGVVLRSGGPNASWINGKIVTSGSVTSEGVRVETGVAGRPSVRISLPGSERTVRLKPGQKIELGGGRVLDAYETEGSRGDAIDLGVGPEADDATEQTTTGSVE